MQACVCVEYGIENAQWARVRDQGRWLRKKTPIVTLNLLPWERRHVTMGDESENFVLTFNDHANSDALLITAVRATLTTALVHWTVAVGGALIGLQRARMYSKINKRINAPFDSVQYV